MPNKINGFPSLQTKLLPLALTLTISNSISCISEETRIRMEEMEQIEQQRRHEEAVARQIYQNQRAEAYKRQVIEWENNSTAYVVSEDGLSLFSTDCTVTQNESRIGTVEQIYLALAPQLTYYDINGNCIAVAKKEIISIGNEINIYSCDGQLIGSIEERVIQSYFSISTTYSIRDAQNREIAVSSATHFLGSKFTIRTPDDQTVIMTANNSNIISDEWSMRLSNSSELPDFFYILLLSFKTFADNKKEE